MNIFPNRKSSKENFYKDFNKDFINYKNSKINNEKNKYPSVFDYNKLNDQLLKSYLKITKKKDFEKNIEKKLNNKSQSTNTIFEINCLNKINSKIYEVSQDITLKDHLDIFRKKNIKVIFDYKNDYLKNIETSKKINDIEITDIVKNVFLTVFNEILIPSFCNIWLFGEKNSICIQGTYIPMEEGSYSENDYIDIIVDLVGESYLTLSDDDIYKNIDKEKDNEKLFFLIIK